MQYPGRYFANNVSNLINLLNAMVDHKVLRFVFSSSAGVYGEPETVPIPEESPMAPLNPYGESKAVAERLLRWYDSQCGLRYVSLRYFNAAGATEMLGEDHRPETHLIPVVLRAAAGKLATLDIYGTDYPTRDGTCVRDYVHVSDLAEAHTLALERTRHGSAVYNLGNGQGFSNGEVVEIARRVTGRPIPVREAPRREGDPASLVASATKAREELGWAPRFPDLGEIIATAWRWHQAHPNGYEQRSWAAGRPLRRRLDAPGERLSGQHAIEDALEGHGVRAKPSSGKEIAGANPAVGVEAHAVRVVVALEIDAERLEAESMALSGVAFGLLDLADEAGVHVCSPWFKPAD